MKNNIDFWGPLGWDWLHNLANCYPVFSSEADIHIYYLKIKNFIEKLPCEKCKKHAIQYILKNPINLSSRREFQYWTWLFHNSVNEKLRKKTFTLIEYDIKYRTNLH